MRVDADQKGTLTYALKIAAGIAAVLDEILTQPKGHDGRAVFNLVSEGDTDWASFAEAIFDESQARGGQHVEVDRITTADYQTPASRPVNSRLNTPTSSRFFGHTLPASEDGVRRCIDALEQPYAGP
jgi:dTDP-4-dehydrorhamnose reductase